MEQKNQTKCPVCGKFTTEAKKRAYDEMVRKVENLTKSLEYRDMEKHADEELLEKKRQTIKEQAKQIELLRKSYEEQRKTCEALADENVELRVENARLQNRGLWERIVNK